MRHEDLNERFEQQRARLHAVAFRILGSASDADDAVQEAWLRFARTDVSDVVNLDGWLTTVVARVCLTMLQSRKTRREAPLDGAALDAALDTTEQRDSVDPADEAVLAESVGRAMLVVLDTLSPAERLAFVLHDMFAMPFAAVAAVLGRSTEATRQLASRARRRVRGAPSPDRAADLARQREVATAFLAAARGGDFSALVSLLDDEVVLTSDPQATPAGRPGRLRGPAVVAQGAVASSVRAGVSQLALVDGSVGVVYAPAGRLQIVLTFTVSTTTRKISAIDVIADPGRLRRLRLAVLPD